MSAGETLPTCWRSGVSMVSIAHCGRPGSRGSSWRVAARGPIAGSRRAVRIRTVHWRLCATAWGFLPGSVCPHYDGEKQRRPTLLRFIATGQLPDGFALEDCVAAHFVGRRFIEAVSSRSRAKAYRVVRVGKRVVEEVIPTRFLGVASGSRVG